MPFEKTDEYYRFRQKDPSKYESFRTDPNYWHEGNKKIRAIFGLTDPREGYGESEVQSLLFKRDDWTKEEAKDWLDDHKKFHHSDGNLLLLLIPIGLLAFYLWNQKGRNKAI